MLVSVCWEREREREETMGLRNWEIILEEMRIKMGDEVKTFEPNCYVNKSSPCNGISCLWEGKNLKATFKRVGCNAWIVQIHSQPNGLAP